MIGECHSTGVSSEVAEKYRAVTTPQDRELFLDFCLYTILYQPSSQGLVDFSNHMDQVSEALSRDEERGRLLKLSRFGYTI